MKEARAVKRQELTLFVTSSMVLWFVGREKVSCASEFEGIAKLIRCCITSDSLAGESQSLCSRLTSSHFVYARVDNWHEQNASSSLRQSARTIDTDEERTWYGDAPHSIRTACSRLSEAFRSCFAIEHIQRWFEVRQETHPNEVDHWKDSCSSWSSSTSVTC